MKKKFLGKLLTMLLVVSMVLTLLPTSALAAWGSWDGWYWSGWSDFLNWGSGAQDDAQDDAQDNGLAGLTADGAVQADTVDNSEFLRIFHLDCGRKYFTVDQINAIIDQLAANHYTHIELAFGNDGLRFLLDDMSVTVGEKEYSSDAVTAAIKYGNTTEFDKEQKYLSASSGELSESDMGLIFQHANEKGIQIIPMMDVPGHMNAVIQAMDKLGITGSTDKVYYRCNNKGRSFNPTDTTKVDFVKALMAKYIAYFSGKNCKYFNIAGDECGFEQMDGTTYNAFISLMNDLNASIKGAGMTTMMFNDGVYNTHINADSYENKFDTDIIICYWTAGEHYATSSELAQSFNLINTYGHWYYVAGNTTSNWGGYQYALSHMSQNGCTACDGGATANTGCMLAYWCDDPSVNYDNAEAARVATYIQTLAKNNSDYFKASSTPVQPEGLTLSFGSTSLAVGGKTTVTASKGVATWESSNETVAKIKASTDKATDATLYAASEGTATITATAADGETASVDVTVTAQSAADKTEEFTITVGATRTFTQSGDVTSQVGAFNPNNGVATVKTSYAPGSGTRELVEVTTVDDLTDGQYLIATSRGDKTLTGTVINNRDTDNSNRLQINGDAGFNNKNLWTITKQSNGTYTVQQAGEYLTIGNGTASTSSTSEKLTLNTCSGSGWENRSYVSWSGWDISLNNYYLNQYGGEYSSYAAGYKADNADGGSDRGSCWKIYKISSGEPQTTITFTGTTPGTTEIKIGDTLYKITVEKEDLSNAPDLHVQLWITNTHIEYNSTKTTAYFGNRQAQYVTIGATEELNTDKGVLLSACVPQVVENCYEYDGTYWSTRSNSNNSTDGPHTFKLYKGTLLSADNVQQVWQDDRFYSGTDFQYIRYLGGRWWISNDQLNWTEITDTDGGATKSTYSQQIVAYYLRQTDVTKEVTTYVKDWGYRTATNPIQTKGDGQVALTIAVVYPDGTVSPSESSMYADSTVIRNFKSSDFDLGLILPENNSNYNIKKITVTDGKRDKSNPVLYWTSSDSITWEKVKNEAGNEWYDEATVWSESYSTAPAVYGHEEDITWTAKDTAKLVLIYLEAVKKDENLNLVYRNDADNCDIKSSQISVSYTAGGTLPTYLTALMQKSEVKTGQFTLDDDAYVVNSSNKEQKINKDITIVPDIDAKYRSGVYQYVGAEISNDGKTLTLHYNLNSDKLEHTYILDFGLPLEIPLSDLVDAGNVSDVDTVLVGGQDLSTTIVTTAHGKLSYSKETQKITFQLEKPFDTQNALTGTFNIKYKSAVGGATSKDITIGVLPASNVLYEENFLTQGSEASTGSVTRYEWTETPFDATKVQQTQKVTTDESLLKGYKVFGYDDAYVGTEQSPVTGQLGAWSVSNLSATTMTDALTTSFYGNAFDLIGSCGSDTGRVMVLFTKSGEGKPCKGVIVDTRFSDSSIADTLYQVPWAHVELGEDAVYSVEIYASGSKGTSSVATRSVRAYSYAANNDAFESVLASHGLTMADVEYINTSAADSIAVPTARRSAAASTNGIAAYAATDTATTVEHKAGTHVEIDGFRVYRSSENNTNYPTAEQNVTYVNILDAVDRQFVAYTESEGSYTATVETYEANGGPQNEIYLGNKQYIIFALDGVTEANKQIQVSLRAVNGTTAWNQQKIESNTEMYYNLASVKLETGEVVYAIANTSSDLLAVGNLKLPVGVTVKGASQLSEQTLLAAYQMVQKAPVDPEPEQPTVFAPEYLDASVSTIRFFRNKLVTLTVSASADVAKLTVNGRELRPTNGWLVRMGWSDTYTYVLTDTVKKNDSKTYEIVAFDAGGVSSAAKTVSAD